MKRRVKPEELLLVRKENAATATATLARKKYARCEHKTQRQTIEANLENIKKLWTGGWHPNQIAKFYRVRTKLIAQSVGHTNRNPDYWGSYL